jgi:hypothetical protein
MRNLILATMLSPEGSKTSGEIVWKRLRGSVDDFSAETSGRMNRHESAFTGIRDRTRRFLLLLLFFSWQKYL